MSPMTSQIRKDYAPVCYVFEEKLRLDQLVVAYRPKMSHLFRHGGGRSLCGHVNMDERVVVVELPSGLVRVPPLCSYCRHHGMLP